jgi:5-methylcytosine-specific restriction protein A
MKTFLLTWNPNRWPWFDLAKEANEIAAGKTVIGRWSCGNTKYIQKGDRVFLVRLGSEPKGIVGSGWVVKLPHLDKHWSAEKSSDGKEGLFIEFEWERLINSNIDLPLSLSKLPKGKLGQRSWTPQSSGTQIQNDLAAELERLWAARIGGSSLGSVFADDEIAAFEGQERIALVRHRRREQKLRTAKLVQTRKQNDGRLFCEVPRCGFDFEKVYGVLGKNFAHVHHLKPLSDRESPSETSLNDLAVVCANCHAIIHRGGKCRSLDKLIP